MKINFKNKFRKILSVAGSVLMVGSTVGFAMAAGGGFPTPFVEDNTPNYALVVGASAAATDMTGANSINDYLNTFCTIESESESVSIGGDFSDSVGVREDEIVLGSTVHSMMNKVLTDNKIATLLDSEFNWNNGDGSKTYDFHEEIDIAYDGGELLIQTTLDDPELEGGVVLENDKALAYRYVFDDDLNITKIGTAEADPLYLTILGKEYEVLKMDENSMTVSFSDEKVVKTGDNVVSDGVTLTIGDIFTGSVEVSGVLIKEGRTRTVNGIEVYIDTIAYHSSSDLPSKAIIKVGKDISQTISDGDEYPDEDDTWKWSISSTEGLIKHIGVVYDIKSISYDEDEPEENAITVGGQYALPENYGAVVFEGLTDVDYEDFALSFDDKDLYTLDVKEGDINVAIFEGENDDSITLVIDGTTYETDTIYFRYVPEVVDESNASNNVLEHVDIYFKDIDGDFGNEGRIQLANATEMKLVVKDTEMDVEVVDNALTLAIEEEVISIPLDGENEFTELGGAEDKYRVSVDAKPIGTRDDDVLTHYGAIVRDPEDNADSDRVILSIPDEQVFAKVSILGQGMATVNEVETDGNETIVPELGGIVVLDSEIAGHADKNLVLIGGSCINSATAKVLGITYPTCGADFSLATGIVNGKALIQSFVSPYNAEKIAVVIGGYSATDTTRGVAAFISSDIDFGTVSSKLIA